jgi:hypothetical protein
MNKLQHIGWWRVRNMHVLIYASFITVLDGGNQVKGAVWEGSVYGIEL